MEQQVLRFYGRVLQDEALGPIFMKAIPGDWTPHLERLCAFWSSVMLSSGRYKGNPFQVHARQTDIKAAHFDIWLGHWAATADEIFTKELADRFQAKARNIAASLTAGLFALSPEQIAATRTGPVPA
ncbi:group III truncated hemoglobin [Rhodovibrionaceae bacterium A322]